VRNKERGFASKCCFLPRQARNAATITRLLSQSLFFINAGYNPEIFSHPAKQLAEIHAKYHFQFGGIRKPRCFAPANCDYLNHSLDGLLEQETTGPNPFGPHNINFTSKEVQSWWAANSTHFLEDGVAFWWNDEGETQFLNYQYWNEAQAMAQRMALPGRRHFTINRAFTPGLQRFPVRKTALFEPFIYKNEHFAKTGSGQT
jgi:alpha-glucosidase